MSFKTITGYLAAAVASAGTFAVDYPDGSDRGSFVSGVDHVLSVIGSLFTAPEDITISFGATQATVTYNGATTLPAGSRFTLQLDEQGVDGSVAVSGVDAYTPAAVGILTLGAPGTADADGYGASQSVGAAADAVLDGALVADGVGVADARTGRNVVGAWTTASVITVTGTDMYGNAMVEVGASGTTFTGKKAFKEVTSISSSAAITLATFGTGDVLGLPVYTPNAAMVLAENVDGAAAVAGTIVAGLATATKPTATNADVRGTYDPNSACNGSLAFTLLAALPDPADIGATQYTA